MKLALASVAAAALSLAGCAVAPEGSSTPKAPPVVLTDLEFAVMVEQGLADEYVDEVTTACETSLAAFPWAFDLIQRDWAIGSRLVIKDFTSEGVGRVCGAVEVRKAEIDDSAVVTPIPPAPLEPSG